MKKESGNVKLTLKWAIESDLTYLYIALYISLARQLANIIQTVSFSFSKVKSCNLEYMRF